MHSGILGATVTPAVSWNCGLFCWNSPFQKAIQVLPLHPPATVQNLPLSFRFPELLVTNWDWLWNVFLSTLLDSPTSNGQEVVCCPSRKYGQVPLPSLREPQPNYPVAEEWAGIQRGAPYWWYQSKYASPLWLVYLLPFFFHPPGWNLSCLAN